MPLPWLAPGLTLPDQGWPRTRPATPLPPGAGSSASSAEGSEALSWGAPRAHTTVALPRLAVSLARSSPSPHLLSNLSSRPSCCGHLCHLTPLLGLWVLAMGMEDLVIYFGPRSFRHWLETLENGKGAEFGQHQPPTKPTRSPGGDGLRASSGLGAHGSTGLPASRE